MRLSLGRRSQYQALSSIQDDDEAGDFEPLLQQQALPSDENARSEPLKPKPAVEIPTVANAGNKAIRLLVLKLNGTSFHISVPSGATVGEMKLVLEKTMNEFMLDKEGYCDIQWERIWGHFCLCYMNQKLLDDRASLRAFGIQDDDQVAFAQHSAHEQGLQPKRKSFLFFA